MREFPRVISLQGYISEDPPTTSAFVAAQEESLRRLGVEVLPFFVQGRRIWKYPQSVGSFRRFVRASKADLVHAHFSYNGAIALCQRSVPVVMSLTGGDVHVSQYTDAGAPIQAAFTYVLTQATALIADQVIVKSDVMRSAVWRRDSVHVLPNGVDLAMFKPLPRAEARQRLELSEEKRYVLFPSWPSRPEKDYPLAVAAFSVAAAGRSDMELLVLDGVPHSDVPLYLNAVDALLFTSKSEGSPNAIKEAMACNLPIVSVNVGDVASVVEGTAQCVAISGRSPEVLGSRLREILDRGVRSNGRERALRYDSTLVAHQLLSIYRAAIDGRRGVKGRAGTEII